jgi:hypothetical protein
MPVNSFIVDSFKVITNIRLTTYSDIPVVLNIYATARKFMLSTGNINQWVNGYPTQKLIEEDIESGHSFVVENNYGVIVGVFCFIIGEDSTYTKIYNGKWLNEDEYGTIHRIASAGIEKGVCEACIKWSFTQILNVRIDTHRDNKVMQNILTKLDFKYCGIIYLHDGAERLAYQKVL